MQHVNINVNERPLCQREKIGSSQSLLYIIIIVIVIVIVIITNYYYYDAREIKPNQAST